MACLQAAGQRLPRHLRPRSPGNSLCHQVVRLHLPPPRPCKATGSEAWGLIAHGVCSRRKCLSPLLRRQQQQPQLWSRRSWRCKTRKMRFLYSCVYSHPPMVCHDGCPRCNSPLSHRRSTPRPSVAERRITVYTSTRLAQVLQQLHNPWSCLVACRSSKASRPSWTRPIELSVNGANRP